MADKYVQLPSDINNTGRKVRTNERTVGSDAVNEHFNILQDRFSDVQGSVLTADPSGSEGGLVVRNVPSGVQRVTGSLALSAPVSVENFPLVQQVTGSVLVSNFPGFPAIQSVTGSLALSQPVAVSNFPASQVVTGSVGLAGPVAVSNLPAVQSVTGSLSLTQGVAVSSMPPVTGSVGLSGPVAVSNFPSFPATQAVTGSLRLSEGVAVANFPAVQVISGSNWIPTVTGSVRVENTVQVAGAVSVSNFPATQAVTGSVGISAPVAVSNFPATQQVTGSIGLSGPVAISNLPAVQNVTGSLSLTQAVAVASLPAITGSVRLSEGVAVTNFPASQTVTGSVSLSVAPTVLQGGAPWSVTGSVGLTAPVAVSNFPAFPATQVVSGSNWIPTVTGSVALSAPAAISNFPATQAVTGSLTLASAPTVLQGGSPWSVTGSVGLSGPVAVSNLPAVQSVTGSVSLSQGVAVTNFPASQTVTGSVGITSPVTVVQDGAGTAANGWFVRVTDGTNTAGVSAKGTQGAFAGSVQDLKDAGRQQVMLSWEEVAGTAGAESALTNFTLGSRNATALTAANNYAVTAGKTLRIQSVLIYVKATSTVNNLARFRIRQAGAVANSSPVIWDGVLSLQAPGTIAAGLMTSQACPIADGLEVAAGQQITFTWFTAANTCTVGMAIVGFEY